MYARCISCHSSLGRNDVLEQFPVGRRLAFDPTKGRLWALCRSCRQWNLAPIEERWEAVEAAEKLFEDAAVGASTENVALGRVADGTELVRIGRVLRPELAAWRYGDRLVGRWRVSGRFMKVATGVVVAAGAIPVLGGLAPAALMGGGLGWLLLRDRKVVMRTGDGQTVRRGDAMRALLVPAAGIAAWQLVLPRLGSDRDLVLAGDDALLTLRRLLPRTNLGGGGPDQVRNAVDEVARLGHPQAVLHAAAVDLGNLDNMDGRQTMSPLKRSHRVFTGHLVLRLALEIAVNEETERRALEGEMGLLEREWREAEELAEIADDLLFPSRLRERLGRLRRSTQDSG